MSATQSTENSDFIDINQNTFICNKRGSIDDSMFRSWTSKAINELDAAIFSGDEMLDPIVHEQFKNYLLRWLRKLKQHKETMQEIADEQE